MEYLCLQIKLEFGLAFYCVVWKDIANVFPAFTIRLFEVNHVWISFMTLFSLDWTVFKLSPDINMFVSSANSTIFDSKTFNGKSFMYNKNNIGPRVEPCGTPCVISLVVETYVPCFLLLISTHCFQRFKWEMPAPGFGDD